MKKTMKNNKHFKGKTQNKTRRKKKDNRQFLYNPDNPKKSFDVYIDKNPNDTIHIKYTTVEDVKNTIQKLEKLYKSKKYSHKRIWQVGMIMKVRLEAMNKHKNRLYKNAKKVFSRYILAKRYFKFLSKRSKEGSFTERKKMVFEFNKTLKNMKGGKWSMRYKKSINCNNPKGFSQKQYCKYSRKSSYTKKKRYRS
tara:strand:+ start:2411 stop:2995 length:585 start_codon:yes stop_codon:yes gene_type:complete